MKEPIKVGDLVVTVRGCCDGHIGKVFRVAEIYKVTGKPRCIHCHKKVRAGSVAVTSEADPINVGGLLSWQKRIPPMPELADERHDEEITA